MFTQTLEPLSAYSRPGLQVIRDCEFFSAGKIPTRLRNRLVPIGDAKYLRELQANLDGVAGVLCPESVAPEIPSEIGCAVTADPMGMLYRIHNERLHAGKYWTSFPSRIDPSANVHPKAHVADTDVVIGPDAVIDPGAVIMERSIIGARAYIGQGTIIGTRAYEIGRIDGKEQLLPQAGGVQIGDDVTILAGTTIAISVFPLFTRIGNGSAIDNLCHVAHYCLIGEGVKVTAGVILAGRVTLQDKAYIGPNATISNGVTIGVGSKVTIGSVVVDDVADGVCVSGNFAVPHRDHLLAFAAKRRRPGR